MLDADIFFKVTLIFVDGGFDAVTLDRNMDKYKNGTKTDPYRKSFKEIQCILKKRFGCSSMKPKYIFRKLSYPAYSAWSFKNIEIEHYLINRISDYEILTISNNT